MYSLDSLKRKKIWKYFFEISKIPRCSGDETKIIQYIENIAKKNNLNYKKDKNNNLVINLPFSSKNKIKSKKIVLQSHVDMVCEKEIGHIHDFFHDKIKLQVKNNYVSAYKTTLGADNGIGVASMLALIDEYISCKNYFDVDLLFTTAEETGLTGAFKLNKNFVNPDILINLDSEDINVCTIGCAGGINSEFSKKISFKTKKIKNYDFFNIEVKGLIGGHSGVDIDKNRGNAIKILSNILKVISNLTNIYISDISGGNKRNAIPRESKCLIYINSKNINEIKKIISKKIKEIKSENENFSNLKISFSKYIENDIKYIDSKASINLINFLISLPNGILKIEENIKKVKTSTNLSKIEITHNNLYIYTLQRSSFDYDLNNLIVKLKTLSEICKFNFFQDGYYPGWKPDSTSNVLKKSKNVFKRIFKKDLIVEVIHAGLECGIFYKKFNLNEMISIGPTILNPHSPDEKVDIKSVDIFYKFLIELLKQ